MMIERAIGLLKGRFRSLLDTLPMKRTDLIPKYIVACCILHNICLIKDDYIDIPIIVEQDAFAQDGNVNANADLRQEGIDLVSQVCLNRFRQVSVTNYCQQQGYKFGTRVIIID